MQLYCYFIIINPAVSCSPKAQMSAGTSGFAYKPSHPWVSSVPCDVAPADGSAGQEQPSLSCWYLTWMRFPTHRSSFLIRHHFLTSLYIEETNMIIWDEISLSSKIVLFLSLLNCAFCGEVSPVKFSLVNHVSVTQFIEYLLHPRYLADPCTNFI